jgi:hypothetical protein
MNYAQARPLEDASGWHFTVRNDDRIWPHPCCREPGPPATPDDVSKYGYELGAPTLGKAHAAHPTREEAEACLHRWRLEQAGAWRETEWSNWTGCEVCDEPTKKAATYRDVGGQHSISLCDEHRNAEQVRAYVDEHRVTSAVYS